MSDARNGADGVATDFDGQHRLCIESCSARKSAEMKGNGKG